MREFKELRSILEIPNCVLRFKHNISQIIQERIEKNVDINTSKNNYYTKANPNTDIFNLRSIINNMFNPYLKSHHIDINKEIEEYEKERDKKEKENLGNKVKIYGIKTKEKLIKKKNNENNEEGNNKRNSRHHNYYVADETKKKPKEENIEKQRTNCKRKSVIDKIEEEKKQKEEKEKKEKEEKEKIEKEKKEKESNRKINVNKYMPPPVDMIIRMNRRNNRNNTEIPNNNNNLKINKEENINENYIMGIFLYLERKCLR